MIYWSITYHLVTLKYFRKNTRLAESRLSLKDNPVFTLKKEPGTPFPWLVSQYNSFTTVKMDILCTLKKSQASKEKIRKIYIPYKTYLWRPNLRRPKFWRSENMAKLNKNRQISDVTENKGIFHHFLWQ